MTLFLVIMAVLAGTALGIAIRMILDDKLIEDAWGEWDKLYAKEKEAMKSREKRMVAEITRLHALTAPINAPENKKDKVIEEEWLTVLKDTSEAPEWEDVDFGGF